jgi:hypothetical protein
MSLDSGSISQPPYQSVLELRLGNLLSAQGSPILPRVGAIEPRWCRRETLGAVSTFSALIMVRSRAYRIWNEAVAGLRNF